MANGDEEEEQADAVNGDEQADGDDVDEKQAVDLTDDEALSRRVGRALVTTILPQLHAFLVEGSRSKTLGDELAATVTKSRGCVVV